MFHPFQLKPLTKNDLIAAIEFLQQHLLRHAKLLLHYCDVLCCLGFGKEFKKFEDIPCLTILLYLYVMNSLIDMVVGYGLN